MSTTRTLISVEAISVEEYLASSYEPDCDYVDGQIEERNLGERTHARFQLRIGAYLLAHYEQEGVEVGTEWRVQVKPTRFRIPDVCVILDGPGDEILTKPPFLCIEILSPEDRMSRIEVRINDYLTMGVPYVWVLDPQTEQAYVATPTEGLREVKDGVLRTESPVLEVPLGEIFR
jgi:Uma2 family endonuclease